MRLAGYLRVSTQGQADDGLGLVVQRRSIRTWAKANRHQVVTWCVDEAISGTMEATDRPGLSEALALVRDNHVGGLVVARLDRLARSLTVQEATLSLAWKHGGTVFSVDSGEIQQDDPDDPMRTFVRHVMGAAAQLERGMITARLRSGRMLKAERGGYAHGAPSYGLRAEGKALVVDDDEAETLSLIAAMHRDGLSLREMAAELTKQGRKPKRSDRWHPESLRRIVARL